MGRTACTEPQCLYKGALYLTSVPAQGCTLPYLSVCTRVHFTLPQCLHKGALYLTSVPVQGCTLPYISACTRVHFTLLQCLYKGALYLTFLRISCHLTPEENGDKMKTDTKQINCHVSISFHVPTVRFVLFVIHTNKYTHTHTHTHTHTYIYIYIYIYI